MANVKISALPAVTTVVPGSDVLPLVSGGVTTKATPNDVVKAVLPAPGAIGGTTAAAGTFTNLTYTGTLTGSTGVLNIGSGQVYKDASGNVGIGTSSPVSAGSTYHVLSINGSTGAQISWLSNGTSKGYAFCDASNMTWGAASVSTFETNGAERMRLDSSGNLGLGTTSPGAKLDVTVAGANLVQQWVGTSGVYHRLGTSTSSFYTVHNGSTDTFLYTQEAAALRFGTNATERARIDSSGNLLVGTTDSGLTTGAGIKVIPAQSGAGVGALSIVTGGSTSANSSIFLYSTVASAYRFYVRNDGAIFATNTTVQSISDISLKENVRDLDYGLNTVLALKPRRFDWKEGKGLNKKDDIGFVAQEFEQIVPEFVDESLDKTDDGVNLKTVGAAGLIPVLVKAIQELSADLNEIKAKVNA